MEELNNDPAEKPISDVEPYRSPAAVSDAPQRSTRMGWIGVLGILLCASVAMGYAWFASEQSPNEHVGEFGYESRVAVEDEWNRGGRIEEPEFIDQPFEEALAP